MKKKGEKKRAVAVKGICEGVGGGEGKCLSSNHQDGRGVEREDRKGKENTWGEVGSERVGNEETGESQERKEGNYGVMLVQRERKGGEKKRNGYQKI